MSQPDHPFTSAGFAKTFVLPALTIFLIPVLSWLFFSHAQATFNSEALESITSQIQAATDMTPAQKEQALAFYRENKVSDLLQEDPKFAATVSSDARFQYDTFRWAIIVSATSVLSGVGVFVLAGLFVLLSLRSPMAQYLSLSAGWHVLRIYGALQAVAQGALLVALSYWVTALWFNIYVIKLIAVVAIAAVIAVAVLIKGIFKRVSSDHEVEGEVISSDQEMPLWQELERLCQHMGTAPPDHVIVGINDNFFVTEHPVIVDSQTYTGRKLFVSLSLLKQLNGGEADAVLAHEMAHFSGNDTVFSCRISPLLVRYAHYLEALAEGGITLPIYYFMLCFRGMFELSLSKLSREREYRADRLAADATSPSDFAGALLRISAYSTYRANVEGELFMTEQTLDEANVSERIEAGFPAYAGAFLEDPAVRDLETAHPFDSHPPLDKRLGALGVSMEANETAGLLAEPGDGRWFHNIHDAANLERQQWDAFEQQFQSAHQESLPYRFLPETDEERAVVEAAFPPVTFSGDDPLTLDYEKMHLASWEAPVPYAEIYAMALDDKDVLTLTLNASGEEKFKTTMFGPDKEEVVEAIGKYYGRYKAAEEYLEFKKASEEEPEES